ncbi:glycosyltransferase family 1 protein [Chthonobacter albigriseus]|uniref:GumK N-terminal domain-containing glycosyltransferase n=1 Tax=Chthonobacter albigriseus TaxID=1683161 RepID=UPI0015EE6674|nr:glycosyltransferase family 1 protein [Chthonobacter albigriseus]
MNGRRFLLVTAHDHRTRRKVNVHFIADALKASGDVAMFSAGFSLMSRIRGRDPRLCQGLVANTVVRHDGVDCFLWQTAVHPGSLRSPVLRGLMDVWFRRYQAAAPAALTDMAERADTIIVESGVGVLFVETLRRANPKARLVYLVSDDLATIAIDPFVIGELERVAPLFDYAVLPSPLLARSMPAGMPRSVFVPHGLDLDPDAVVGPNPYEGGIDAVSVGSMLFDTNFFRLASEVAPEVTFHVIGAGVARPPRIDRVRWYPEMRYADTLAYIRHARFGIAPYARANAPYYLADTSMKLMQFGCFGLPAVCPDFVVGRHAGSRFGYTPGDAASIGAAIRAALGAGPIPPPPVLSWREVADRILDPDSFSDTALPSAEGDAPRRRPEPA